MYILILRCLIGVNARSPYCFLTSSNVLYELGPYHLTMFVLLTLRVPLMRIVHHLLNRGQNTNE